MTTQKTRKKSGALLSGRFKSQRTEQVDSAFAARERALESRARQIDAHITLQEVDALRLDGGTQPRVTTDAALVDTYAERMVWSASSQQVVDHEDLPFDPITFYDDDHGSLWLADGFHRVLAARKLGITHFQAKKIQGNQHDAFVYSLGANATHGKRRSNADKRRAVERALTDATLRKLSDRRVATLCKVSNRFVSTVRAELEAIGEIPFERELQKVDGSLYERLVEPTTPPPRKTHTARAASPSPTSAASSGAIIFASHTAQFGAFITGLLDDPHLDTLCDILTPYPGAFGTLQGFNHTLRDRLGSARQHLWHGPRPIYVRDHDRIYAMWSTSSDLPVSTTTQRLHDAHTLHILGAPTEPW